MKLLPKQPLYRFREKTLSLALEYVKAYIANTAEEQIKSFFIKNPESNKGVPQEIPYKTFAESFYTSVYAKVETKEDQRLFAHLCRVMIYRYAIHKGYVSNRNFTISDYLANTGKQLYLVGVLKLGREDMPVNTSQVVQATDIVLADMLELETKVTAVGIESTKSFIKQREEPNMNQITSLANVTKTQATLIHGRLLSELSEDALIAMIRKARKQQEDIKDLVDASTRMKARYEQLEADIKVYAEALDSLPNGDQPF